jgi:hypothetical protein
MKMQHEVRAEVTLVKSNAPGHQKQKDKRAGIHEVLMDCVILIKLLGRFCEEAAHLCKELAHIYELFKNTETRMSAEGCATQHRK